MSKKARYLIVLALGLFTGVVIVPMVLEWMGFSLAGLLNQIFGEPDMTRWVIGAVVLIIFTYFTGRSIIRNYRSIKD